MFDYYYYYYNYNYNVISYYKFVNVNSSNDVVVAYYIGGNSSYKSSIYR